MDMGFGLFAFLLDICPVSSVFLFCLLSNSLIQYLDFCFLGFWSYVGKIC